MNETLMKVLSGLPVTDSDLENDLASICKAVRDYDEESSEYCYSECPVFKANGGVPYGPIDDKNYQVCVCFGNGRKMLEFLRKDLIFKKLVDLVKVKGIK